MSLEKTDWKNCMAQYLCKHAIKSFKTHSKRAIRGNKEGELFHKFVVAGERIRIGRYLNFRTTTMADHKETGNTNRSWHIAHSKASVVFTGPSDEEETGTHIMYSRINSQSRNLLTVDLFRNHVVSLGHIWSIVCSSMNETNCTKHHSKREMRR